MIAHEIPARTGVRPELPTRFELVGHERIVAVRECVASPGKTLSPILHGRIDVLYGEDIEMFGMLCAGRLRRRRICFRGASSRWSGGCAKGSSPARAIWHTLVPMVRAALAQRGLIRNELRAPMTRASEEREAVPGRLEDVRRACGFSVPRAYWRRHACGGVRGRVRAPVRQARR